MTDESPADKPAPPKKGAGVEGVVDDVFGVDFKIVRTLRDLVIRPGRVADAALAHDHSRYTRPVRVFLALLTVQTLLYGWVGFYDAGSLAAGLENDPAGLAAVEARLAAVGSSLAEADEVLARWTAWATSPITTISSLLYALVVWLMRRRLGLVNAVMLYLVATNASSVTALPLLVVGMTSGAAGSIAAALASFVLFFLYLSLVLHRRAADTAMGLTLRMLGLILAIVPVVVVTGALLYLVVEVAVRAEIGVWRTQLLFDAAIARAGPPP